MTASALLPPDIYTAYSGQRGKARRHVTRGLMPRSFDSVENERKTVAASLTQEASLTPRRLRLDRSGNNVRKRILPFLLPAIRTFAHCAGTSAAKATTVATHERENASKRRTKEEARRSRMRHGVGIRMDRRRLARPSIALQWAHHETN